MARMFAELGVIYLVALGTVLGGSAAAGAAATLAGHLPLSALRATAQNLKFWGTLAAVGGTTDVLAALERGLLGGEVAAVARQVLRLLAGFAGAQTAAGLVQALTRP